MKHFLALMLVASLLAPTFALAVLDSDGVDPAPPSLADSQFTKKFDTKGIIESGSLVGCGTGGKGGALPSNFAQSLSQALGGILRNKANKFLGDLPGPIQNMAQQLLDRGNNQFSNYVADALKGTQLESVLGSGSASSIVQNLVSGGGGSGAVPVDVFGLVRDLTRTINDQTKATEDATTLAIQKICVGDLAATASGKAIDAQLSKDGINMLGKSVIPNLGVDIAAGQLTIFKGALERESTGLCTKDNVKEDAKAMVLTDYQRRTTPNASTQCAMPNGGAAGGAASNVYQEWILSAEYDTGGAIGNYIAIDEATEKAVRDYTYIKELELTQVNENPVRKCTDGSEVLPGGVCKDGLYTSEVVTPYKVIEALGHAGLLSAQKQAQEAKKVGELPNATVASLMSILFEGLNGLVGLSQSNGSQGSFLDEMVSDTGGEAQVRVQGGVISDIETAIGVEEEYRYTTGLVYNSLTNSRNYYSQAAACYKTKLDTQKSAAASSTIATLLDPEIARLTREMDTSDDALDELYILLSQAESALTPNDVVAVHNQFTALIDAGLIHTTAELDMLNVDLAASADALSIMSFDAVAQLAECLAL